MGELRKNVLVASVLILIDQITKIFVNIFFKHISFRFFNNKIGFDVYLNEKYMSIFNGTFNLELSLKILVFLNILTLFFVIVFYLYVLKNKGLDRYMRTCIIITISAISCSIIDKIFWGGSLDFLVIFGYIVDIKDIYVFFGLTFGYLMYINKYYIFKRNLEEIEKLSFKGYVHYLIRRKYVKNRKF